MDYHLDLFTPATWQAFVDAGSGVTGFRQRHKRLASERVNKGDFFLCYLTRLSRWCGMLRVVSEMYEDGSPLLADQDPYVQFPIRFAVEPLVVLEPALSIPIRTDEVWNGLSITKQYAMDYPYWTGFFRGSLNTFNAEDGAFLATLLEKQQGERTHYPLSDKETRELASVGVLRTLDRRVEVEVPDDEMVEAQESQETVSTSRQQSLRVQARVAQIGAEMGFRIWVPRNDKARVKEQIPDNLHIAFLEELPLNYNDTTIRTIEQIDVLWLKNRSMARAFEIEHTTAIHSGLLRMADLLALQPNMDIHLHIVAPDERREQVLREIRRPVFSLLEKGPLYEQCSYLSYEAVETLSHTPNLRHINDTIIGEYEETAEV
ncbi:MAG: hypothetical protein J4G13_06410 [Dehalococcoidia bacterium]|nr:hypothetical protein [Dehalococcoidia bacterium]